MRGEALSHANQLQIDLVCVIAVCELVCIIHPFIQENKIRTGKLHACTPRPFLFGTVIDSC